MIQVTLIATAAVAGCSGGIDTGLTTGSLFGSSPASVPAAVETPSMRAAGVAAVSARAARCGYNFDPARLKSGFLASELGQGSNVDDVGKLERDYDTIRVKVAAAISGDGGFCDETKTRGIKADLTRYLAGDYALPADQKKIDERLLANAPRAREVFNQEYLRDKTAPKTKRIEE